MDELMIIRKPDFMRNDALMLSYFKEFGKTIDRLHDATDIGDMCETVMTTSFCLNRAAEEGGFRSTKDFIKWVKFTQSQ